VVVNAVLKNITQEHTLQSECRSTHKNNLTGPTLLEMLRALETFRTLGIEFVSLSENIDTSTPTGKMVFTVLASVAELERSLIGKRVRAGLRNAKVRGTRLGRPPVKDLSVTETQRLRRERLRPRTRFKGLAEKYGVSVWTAFQLCKRASRE
jgi:DNA invertase Pin-like site-specific DNA recombinase